MSHHNPTVLSSSSITGDKVKNLQGENLGDIKDLMIDLSNGRVSYAVLSFGGFMGMGDKLFAVPWQALTLDAEDKTFVLNVSKEKLENAPGFDKDDWPNMAGQKWGSEVHRFYDVNPYWS